MQSALGVFHAKYRRGTCSGPAFALTQPCNTAHAQRMGTSEPEFHGSPDQQAVLRKASALWSLVRDDPRFGTHGRAVGISFDGPGQLDDQVSLARLQGISACENVPSDTVENWVSRLNAAGLKTDQFENWASGADALKAARAIMETRKVPDDLELVYVDSQTPPADMVALDRLTQSCGVLLPSGAFMRGQQRPAVCVFLRDKQGVPVCTSAAVHMFHPDHPRGAQSWWGMLATSPDRRGEGLALTLGAQSMLAMNNRFGTTQFFTGIRKGNIPSQKLCSRLRLAPSGHWAVIAIDPTAFSSDRLTK